ncbi:unnamed protein product, partial [Choristocarpus tenellus]
LLVSSSLDCTVRVWESLGMSEKYCMRQPSGEIASMTLLQGGSVVATGIDDGSVRFWNLETGAGTSSRAHSNTVSALASHRDNKNSLLFASGCYNGDIVLWEAQAKDGVHNAQIPKVDSRIGCAHKGNDGQDTEILALAFVEGNGSIILVSGGNNCALHCWDFQRR